MKLSNICFILGCVGLGVMIWALPRATEHLDLQLYLLIAPIFFGLWVGTETLFGIFPQGASIIIYAAAILMIAFLITLKAGVFSFSAIIVGFVFSSNLFACGTKIATMSFVAAAWLRHNQK